MLKFISKRRFLHFNLFDLFAFAVIIAVSKYMAWSVGGSLFWFIASLKTTNITSVKLEKSAGHDYTYRV